jgi:DNA polymerase
MAVTVGPVGGIIAESAVAEAKSALAWWIEAGVDCAVSEAPRNWLESPKPPEKVPAAAEQPNVRIPEPETLDALKTWLATGVDLPLSGPSSKRAMPHGPERAEVMLFCEAPASEDAAAERPIAGVAWAMTERMLAAIGIAPDEAYSASLSCFHAPGKKMSESDRALCAEIARRHIRLAQPKRLILFGDGPSMALLGKRLTEARGHLFKVEGVRAVATFHPRHLVNRPLDKALAWKDLLLLMEDAR